ncbi:hypothetical protein CPLU01_05874 [Colletotrichum plurivorum]|uniref:Uncharacterized protein n=1 Tax=Colletotrichum plurivorum TaxID=2175906 RepID=A0A8H6NHN3_9PEZI|nr:hypothetical protein CPLU01_05874 [Colletotrichum plurivorum]
MPLVGSNSLAILAACRVSPLSKAPRGLASKDGDPDTELEELTLRPEPAAEDPEGGEKAVARDDIVLYPLKWGEVKMPEDGYLQDDGLEEAGGVGHLGFGTVEDDPQPPTNGCRYR